MVNQATVRPAVGHVGNGDDATIVGSVTEFGQNVATLFELQAKLAAIDAKQCSEKAIWPTVAVAVCAVLAVSAITVGLFGIADLVANAARMRPGLAMILTSASALAIAGGVLYLSFVEIKQSLHPFRRSREELTRNLTWLRTVLLHSGRPAPRR